MYPAEFRQDYLKETGFGTEKEHPTAFDAFFKLGSISEKSGGTIPSKTLIICPMLQDYPKIFSTLRCEISHRGGEYQDTYALDRTIADTDSLCAVGDDEWWRQR
jgi:UTP-glucose-1-phosphate uridylyltransferase